MSFPSGHSVDDGIDKDHYFPLLHNSWGALCTNYLDDFIGVASPDKAKRDFCKLGWLLQDIGVWELEHKACPPSLLMVMLGIMFNMIDMIISTAPEWVDEIQAELDAWCNSAKMSCKQLESLIGKLQFASQVIRASCVFLAHLLDELQGSPKWGYMQILHPFYRILSGGNLSCQSSMAPSQSTWTSF